MNEHITKVIQFIESPTFQSKYSIVVSKGPDEISELDRFLFPREKEYGFEYLKAKIMNGKDLEKHEKQNSMKGNIACCIVEKQTNKIIGFGYLRDRVTSKRDNEGNWHYLPELSYVFVSENYRRRGKDVGVSDVIVHQIIKEIEDPACVAIPNEKMNRLLRRHGFRNGRIYIKDERFEYWGN